MEIHDWLCHLGITPNASLRSSKELALLNEWGEKNLHFLPYLCWVETSVIFFPGIKACKRDATFRKIKYRFQRPVSNIVPKKIPTYCHRRVSKIFVCLSWHAINHGGQVSWSIVFSVRNARLYTFRQLNIVFIQWYQGILNETRRCKQQIVTVLSPRKAERYNGVIWKAIRLELKSHNLQELKFKVPNVCWTGNRCLPGCQALDCVSAIIREVEQERWFGRRSRAHRYKSAVCASSLFAWQGIKCFRSDLATCATGDSSSDGHCVDRPVETAIESADPQATVPQTTDRQISNSELNDRRRSVGETQESDPAPRTSTRKLGVRLPSDMACMSDVRPLVGGKNVVTWRYFVPLSSVLLLCLFQGQHVLYCWLQFNAMWVFLVVSNIGR